MRDPVYSGGIFARFCRETSVQFRRICVAVLFLVAIGAYAQDSLENREKKYEKQIHRTSTKHGVDPLLVKAIIFTESTFLPDKLGKDGEIGLMQIRLSAAKDWAKAKGIPVPTEKEMYQPELNIEIGTWYIARALKRWYENPDFLRMALAEYNAGRTRLLQWLALYQDDTDKMFASKPVGKYADKVCRKYVEYTVGGVNWEIPAAVQPKIAVINP